MKKNKLFEILNDIDEKIIEEAEIKTHILQKKFKFMKILIPLAAVAILIFIILPNFLDREREPEQIIVDKDLPKISMGTFNAQGSGFEALMAYDIEELINANPWDEKTQTSSLPVFKNKLEYTEIGILKNIDLKAMRESLDKTVKSLRINPKEIEIIASSSSEEGIKQMTDNIESIDGEIDYNFEEYIELYVKSEKYKITVYPNLATKINFKAKDKLVKDYYIDYNSSYEDVSRAAKYISKEYKKLLTMKEPIINIYDGDYTYDGDQRFHLSFFEGEGSLEKKIINYNFNYVDFYFDEEDKTNTLRINKADLSQKIGNYPIISSKKAEELLVADKYITNIPEEFPGEEYIKKVELVYRGQYEEYFMPYYLFYVELEEFKEDNGLKTFGAYYVPAIEEEYIDNMDLMDAKFN